MMFPLLLHEIMMISQKKLDLARGAALNITGGHYHSKGTKYKYILKQWMECTI